MAVSVKQFLFRRGILAAAVTASLVGAAMLGLELIQRGLSSAREGLGAAAPGPEAVDAGWGGLGQLALTTVLPFAVGVFLCLWVLLPIAGQLDLRFVVTRALGAALVGALVLVLAGSVMAGVQATQDDDVRSAADALPATLLDHLLGAAGILTAYAALVVVFGIVQWNWLRHHPATFEVAGVLDV